MSDGMTGSQIDRNSPVPLFLQIRQALLAEIRSWPDTTAKFPTDVALADRFKVSKMTVRQAIDDLVEAGLLERHRGRGTFVTDRAFVEQLDPILDIDQQYAAAGHSQTTRVLSFDRRAMSVQEQKLFGMEPGEMVVHIRRLRSANGLPLALDERILPSKIADQAGFTVLNAADSIIARLRRATPLARAKWQMSALLADSDLALNLSIHQGAPVLERAMTYLDSQGVILLTGRSLHRGDLVSCAFELPLNGGDPDGLTEMTRAGGIN
ncbi:MAG: GntR family transcriptional regulator [Alphaproteobacteria bacterium]|nr:GntR family transcriptional regulator [Alphaproteobacteria bacterium]